jgi:hypothetical protein
MSRRRGVTYDHALCHVTGRPCTEGECHWWDPALVSGPELGLSPRWTITVDEEGIAWTWCVDWTTPQSSTEGRSG